MSEKDIFSQSGHLEIERASNELNELQQEKTNNTVSTGFEETDEDFEFGFFKALAFLSIVLGFTSDVFVGAAISAVLSTINEDLGPSTSDVWIVSAQYVVVSITSPFIGRLGDIFGRRNLLILGNLISIVANLVSALGPNINALIAGSVLIGLGGSMHQLGWACIGELVPKRHRPLAMGCFEGSITPLGALGPLIAFSLVEHSSQSWRNIYWICVALDGLALFLVVLFYHPVNQYVKEEGKTRFDQLKSMDFVGFFLFTIGLCLLLIGLSFGGTTYPWKSAGTLAPLLIGVVFLVITGLWERFTHNPYNIFPHAVMKNTRGFSIVTGVTFLVGMLYYSTLILWPLQIQTLYTTSSIKIGLYSMALSFGGLVGGLIFGVLLDHVNQARWILVGICLALTALSGAQAIVSLHSNVGSIVIVALIGAMISAATVASNAMIQLAVPHQYLGVAMGLVTTARNVGGSISTTIYSVILNNRLSSTLGVNIATALAKAGLPLADVPGVTAALAAGNSMSPALANASPAALGAGILALKLTYVDAFKLVYLVSIAFGVIGTICAAFTTNVGHLMTRKIDVSLDAGLRVGLHEVHKGGHVIDRDGKEISRRPKNTMEQV